MSDAIELVIEGRPRPVGTMTVARLLPSPRRRMIGPVIFLDHLGPVELAPGVGFDVLPHPHIGLSTVTYLDTALATCKGLMAQWYAKRHSIPLGPIHKLMTTADVQIEQLEA